MLGGMQQRYELSDGKSHKFWVIQVEGEDVSTRWGRIGTKGQAKTKSLGSPDAARSEADKQIRAKTKKGYALVEDSASQQEDVAEVAQAEAPAEVAQAEVAQAEAVPAAIVEASVSQESTGDAHRSGECPPELWPYGPLRSRPAPALTALSKDAAWELLRDNAGSAADVSAPKSPEEALGQAKRFIAAHPAHKYTHDKRDPSVLADFLVPWCGLDGGAVGFVELLKDAQLDAKWNSSIRVALCVAHRFQHWIAGAEAPSYESALQACEARRAAWNGQQRLTLALMFPNHAPFREGVLDIDAPSAALWLAPFFSAPELEAQLKRLDGFHPPQLRHLAPLGGAAGDHIARGLDAYLSVAEADKDELREMAWIATRFPSDATYTWIASRIDQSAFRPELAKASRRDPERVLRALAPIAAGRSKTKATAVALAGQMLREDAALLERVELPESQRSALAALAESAAPPAALEDCPAVLREPRWKHRKANVMKAMALDVLDVPMSIRWPAGIRDAWATRRGDAYWYASEMSKFEAEVAKGVYQVPRAEFFVMAPKSKALEYIDKWKVSDSLWIDGWIHALVSRYPEKTHRGLFQAMESYQAQIIPYLLPFADVKMVPGVADAFHRLKSARRGAKEWLMTHPETAFIGLIPMVLGKDKKQKQAAMSAIALLAGEGHSDLLVDVAARYGDDAKGEIEKLRDLDSLDDLPKKMPALPEWTASIVAPELCSGGSLPEAALESFVMMLAISTPETHYAGVERVLPELEPASLERFGWSLFEGWQLAGMNSKESWAFTQLGLTGGDECARKLAPILRAWPGDGGHARATQGLDVLAQIGTDVALMNLYGISQKLKFKGLKKKAREKVQEIAAARNLSELELADRLVPDFDLDAHGRTRLDFGPRTFEVSFDEHLKPVLRDDDGKVRKSLPKASKTDDPDKAKDATKRFKTLKKDVKAVAGMQIARLEDAMCAERRWSAEDFKSFFVDHPLMTHLVSRLVWGCFTDDALTHTFRVSEGECRNEDDELFVPAATETIGVVHPLHLSDEVLAAWGTVFADYELLQPFDQLGRAVFELSVAERTQAKIERLKDKTFPTAKVLQLEKHGWRRGDPQDAGGIWAMERTTLGGTLELGMDPGIIVGLPQENPEQTLQTIDFGDWATKPAHMGLNAIGWSEVLRSLAALSE